MEAFKSILNLQRVGQVKTLNHNTSVLLFKENYLVWELTNQGCFQEYLQRSPLQIDDYLAK